MTLAARTRRVGGIPPKTTISTASSTTSSTMGYFSSTALLDQSKGTATPEILVAGSRGIAMPKGCVAEAVYVSTNQAFITLVVPITAMPGGVDVGAGAVGLFKKMRFEPFEDSAEFNFYLPGDVFASSVDTGRRLWQWYSQGDLFAGQTWVMRFWD